MQQLGKLKELLDDQLKKKVELLAVSPDSAEDSRKAVERINKISPAPLNFPLLEDAGHRVIDRYGLLNPSGRGWPHPATYVIDKKGIVRWKFVEVDYKVRPTHEAILEALRK